MGTETFAVLDIGGGVVGAGAALDAAVTRVTEGLGDAIFIAGGAGTGKTSLVGEALRKSAGAERAAVIFYGLVLLSITAVASALWRYVTAHRDLLEADVSDEEVRIITRLTTPGIGFYAGVVVLAVVAPQVAAFAYLAIAVVSVFRQRGDRTAPPRRT